MMDKSNQTIRKIIVFGENHHNTLGLIRSLGEVGLCSYLVLVNSNGLYPFVSKSKYIRKKWIVNNVSEGLNIILTQFKEEIYKPIIYPTFDSEVKILSENDEQLTNSFLMPSIINRKWTLKECLDKEFMRNLAQGINMNTPKSWVIDCSNEIKIPQDLVYPCVIKAIDSSLGPKDYNVHESEESLLQSIDKLSKYCEVLQIQEFISKEKEIILLGWSDGKGNVVIPCLMDKIREYPKGFGTTGYGKVYKNLNAYINVDKVYEYIDCLGYSGLFSVEFILSKGKSYFLEINLRNDGNGYLPTYGGVNLPYQWYLSMVGEEQKLLSLPKTINNDFIMMREFSDIMIPIKYGYSFIKWIGDFSTVDCFLYWNSKDKSPFFYFLFYKMYRFLKNILNE